MPGRLPNTVVIGAMKCGTTALHRYLDAHPDIAMAPAKEVNFFIGPEERPHDDATAWWASGHWHRGVAWYASLFDPAARVRGESSPGYTSPDHEHVPGRMAAVLPEARLLYLVRDPVDRAVSQYLHHRRDGTEARPVAEALLDEHSHYLARSRYHARLEPFLARFPRAQIRVVVSERLLRDRRRELAAVYSHVGADPWWDDALQERFHVGDGEVRVDPWLRREMMARVADDVAALCELVGDEIPEWRR